MELAHTRSYRYLPLISMLSVTCLIISMLFAHRVLRFGPFITPGAVFIFPMTYWFADIVAEVYGYAEARILILGNFLCIFLFNITNFLLIKMPIPTIHEDTAYQTVFGHSLLLIFAFALAFAMSDTCNAYLVSRWKVLVGGRHFCLRSFFSMIIGQTIFTLVATVTIYFQNLQPELLGQQFISTWLIKIIIITCLAYPGVIVCNLLKRLETFKFA
jgi:uncharacterized integral membrane protein (TIGR00697 family)